MIKGRVKRLFVAVLLFFVLKNKAQEVKGKEVGLNNIVIEQAKDEDYKVFYEFVSSPKKEYKEEIGELEKFKSILRIQKALKVNEKKAMEKIYSFHKDTSSSFAEIKNLCKTLSSDESISITIFRIENLRENIQKK